MTALHLAARVELRSACLCSKHTTVWTVFPAPRQICYCVKRQDGTSWKHLPTETLTLLADTEMVCWFWEEKHHSSCMQYPHFMRCWHSAHSCLPEYPTPTLISFSLFCHRLTSVYKHRSSKFTSHHWSCFAYFFSRSPVVLKKKILSMSLFAFLRSTKKRGAEPASLGKTLS